jgi:hypothetical protein
LTPAKEAASSFVSPASPWPRDWGASADALAPVEGPHRAAETGLLLFVAAAGAFEVEEVADLTVAAAAVIVVAAAMAAATAHRNYQHRRMTDHSMQGS